MEFTGDLSPLGNFYTMSEKPKPPQENQKRHIHNLQIYTGFLHGVFFLNGVAKPKEKKKIKKKFVRGN